MASVKSRRREDDGTGLLLIAIGTALTGSTLIVNEPYWVHRHGSPLFLIFTGFVLIARQIWLGTLIPQSALAVSGEPSSPWAGLLVWSLSG